MGSLARQFVKPGAVEIIVVVNNKPNNGTLKWRQTYERNQAVLKLPYYTGGYPLKSGVMPMHVIDLSAPGRCFPDNNVGLARRIGLHEAALRYRRARRNGIILHTDADARYDDPQFAGKVLRIFDSDPTLVGLAGAHVPEVDTNDPESSELAAHLALYVNARRYTKLVAYIRQGHANGNTARKMLGFCMIHRAFEGVEAGSIDPIAFEEDVAFGRRLESYAEAHGMHLAHGQDWQNLGPVMALRASDRTPNSIRSRFLDHVQDDELLVDDIFEPEQCKIRLTDEYIDRLTRVVRTMPGGEEFVRFLFFESSLAHVRIR